MPPPAKKRKTITVRCKTADHVGDTSSTSVLLPSHMADAAPMLVKAAKEGAASTADEETKIDVQAEHVVHVGEKESTHVELTDGGTTRGPVSAHTPNVLQLLSWNLKGLKTERASNTMPLFLRGLLRDLDVVLLQEVSKKDCESFIKKTFGGLKHWKVKRSPKSDCATALNERTVTSAELVSLDGAPGKDLYAQLNRSCRPTIIKIVPTFDVELEEMILGNFHIPFKLDHRKKHLENLRGLYDHLTGTNGLEQPVLFCGDFNTSKEQLQELRDAGMLPYITQPTSLYGDDNCYDNFMTRAESSVDTTKMVLSTPEYIPRAVTAVHGSQSDHHPVVLAIDLTKWPRRRVDAESGVPGLEPDAASPPAGPDPRGPADAGAAGPPAPAVASPANE